MFPSFLLYLCVCLQDGNTLYSLNDTVVFGENPTAKLHMLMQILAILQRITWMLQLNVKFNVLKSNNSCDNIIMSVGFL